MNKNVKNRKRRELGRFTFRKSKNDILYDFCAKLDFQISNPALIPSEVATLEASTALLRRKNFEGWTKVSKIEKCKN